MRRFAVCLLLAGTLLPGGVVVRGPVKSPFSTQTISGSLVITCLPFVAPDGTTYGTDRRTVSILGSNFTVELEAGSSCSVEYTNQARQKWTRYWTIPASGPVTVAQVESGTAPASSLLIALSALSRVGALNGYCIKYTGGVVGWGACGEGGGGGGPMTWGELLAAMTWGELLGQ